MCQIRYCCFIRLSVGALQFVSEANNYDYGGNHAPVGEVMDDIAIEKLLKGLAQAPLGLTRDDDFRIFVAGAQEKTALLLKGKWLKPHGATSTTHILKTQIGKSPNGIDLCNRVENELLAQAFGMPVNKRDRHRRGGPKRLQAVWPSSQKIRRTYG